MINLKDRPVRPRRVFITPSQRLAIIEACRAGEKQAVIAADFRIATSTVSKIARKAGVRRVRRKGWTREDWDRAAEYVTLIRQKGE